MSGLTLLAALKAFDATARAGSMTAAAKLLDLQQPTISAHIQRLENEYGVELFLRQGRRLELTTFGRMELTRFRGHIILCVQGVANVKSTTAVPGGIPPADGRAGSSRALTLAALS